MTRSTPCARRRRRAAFWIAAIVVGGGVRAQSDERATEFVGFPAGPLVIAPSLTVGYEYNSNVFLNTKDLKPSPDQVLTLKPTLQVTLPFANNTFRISDSLSWVDYRKTAQVAGKTSNDAEADLSLRFGSLDNIDLSARRVTGVAETLAFDPGGEVRFEGNSYQLHTESVSIAREVEGSRGYRLALERNVLRFDRSREVFFFDYKGFEGEGAYLQPLSPNTRIAFGYMGSRYDHNDISPGSNPNSVFRTESGDAVYAAIEGRLGPKQPYSVRLGWQLLAFSGNAAKDFSGVIGDARLSAIVGGGTIFTVQAQRQPYRSFFEENNFYVFEQVVGRVDRPFPKGSIVGGIFGFSRNAYGESSPETSPAPGILRRDSAIRLEAYANLALVDRLFFRFSIQKSRKYSNFPGADYDATVVFGGLIFGWI